jgi:hypothetical protein
LKAPRAFVLELQAVTVPSHVTAIDWLASNPVPTKVICVPTGPELGESASVGRTTNTALAE